MSDELPMTVEGEPADLHETEPSLQKDKVEIGEKGQTFNSENDFLEDALPPEEGKEPKQKPEPTAREELKSQENEAPKVTRNTQKEQARKEDQDRVQDIAKYGTNDMAILKAMKDKEAAKAIQASPASQPPKIKEEIKAPENKATAPKTVEEEFPEPTNANKASKEQWLKLRSVAKERGQAVESLKKEVESLKQSTINGIPKALLDEVQELRSFRGAFDVKSDPDFIKNYSEPLDRNISSIHDFLAAQGLPKERTPMLDKDGNPKLDSEGNPILMPGMDDVKDMGIDKIHPKWIKAWHNTLVERGDIVDAQKFLNMMTDNKGLKAKLDQAVADAPKRVEEYRSQRQAKFQEEQKQVNDYAIARIEEMQKMVPWGQPKEIPPNATPEEKALIEKHNGWYKMASDAFAVSWNPRNPQQKVESAAAAAIAPIQAEEIKELQEHNRALRDELDRIKRAGTINRKAADMGDPKPQPQNFTKRTNGKMNDEQELDMVMKARGY